MLETFQSLKQIRLIFGFVYLSHDHKTLSDYDVTRLKLIPFVINLRHTMSNIV